MEIGKISLAKVSRCRCRLDGNERGVGGFLGIDVLRRHRGNFLIWNFRKLARALVGDDVNFQGGERIRSDGDKVSGNDDAE